MEDATVFSDDPAAMAQKWAAAGAQLIHVVDLDGAFSKKPQNVATIRRILDSVEVPIQLGGGIRNEPTVRMYLEMGVQRVVIGTRAIKDPEFVARMCRRFPGRIVVAIDARNGRVAIDGWTQTTPATAVDVARRLEDCGVSTINFTDIQRDGMQTGPNIAAIRRFARSITIPVVAAGGVATAEDIKNLHDLESDGVQGVITGKALYSGSLDFQEALRLAG